MSCQSERSAYAVRMISEWTYWYGASDAQGLTEFEFYGKPWDNFAMYDSLSPIRHVTKVRTPTLIVQSEEDFRTPIGNADLWFMIRIKWYRGLLEPGLISFSRKPDIGAHE